MKLRVKLEVKRENKKRAYIGRVENGVKGEDGGAGGHGNMHYGSFQRPVML